MPSPSRRRAVTAGLALTGTTILLSGAAAHAVPGDTVAGTAYAFTARVAIGAPGVGTSCTGALVAASWVLTARACTDQTGTPTTPITVTLGGQPVAVTRVVPHPDRDAALLRLTTPVTTITPVALGTTAPAAGDTLRVIGYGRTADTWIPDAKHATTVTVTGADSTTLTIDGDTTTCKGDSGGPAVRETGGTAELVAIHRSSWQNGCLGAPATDNRGGVETRTDDLATWIRATAIPGCNATGEVITADQSGGFVRTADLTGDCRHDIVDQNVAGQLRAWPSSGNLSALFTGAGTVVGAGWTTTNIERVVTGDFNGDGKADVIGQDSTGQLRAWAGTGDLSADSRLLVGAATIVGTGWTTTNIQRIITGDFNGDGKTDIIGQSSTGQLRAWASTGDLSGDSKLFVGAAAIVGTGWTPTAMPRILTGDFNGDGRTDIIGQDSTGVLRGSVSTGDLTTLFPTARVVGNGGWTTANMPRIVTGDFNGDGRTDVIGQDSTGQLRAWAATGDFSADNRLLVGAATIVGTGWTTTNIQRIITGDFNGDGRTDIIGQSSAGQLRAWASTGDLTADSKLFVGAAAIVGNGFTLAAYPRVF
ncbi:FG-GAP-like repeat-containing protein [Actinoplanes sp. NBRC 101535]|uniref:FG-GAP-like repeat-containing protein n=1 Tax=Actinoplanes sp. NBRC 101535 TaxID=3032196 RepID=UPI0024A46BFF|nr:FG-GAP-like repeat-containing protein [Actinoplanes sp. NBRC 101535]GLY01207.1 fusidic acid esterase FusH [Actinoplanes sp. NBRC 101535]